MSGDNAPVERPAVVSMGTIIGALGLLIAGTVAWAGMNERVARLEANAAQEQRILAATYATRQELARVESKLATTLDRIADLLCDSEDNARKRACQERAE